MLMSPDDPRAALPWLSFGDLQGCNMISGLENSAEDRMLRRTCQEYGISLSRVYRSDGIETNMRLVRDGMGVVRILLRRVGRAAAPGDRCIAEIHLPAERHEEKRRAALPLLSLRRLPQARNGM